jgi:uroporphyrinogen decarboxylase
MTSRERARAALSFLPVDRPPMDLGSTRVTGMNAWRYGELRQALGLPAGMPRVYDVSGFLAEVEEPVLEALGCDFIMLPLQGLSMGLTPTEWQEHAFWDGNRYLVPADFLPARLEDGALVHGMGPTGDGVVRRMPVGGRYFERVMQSDVDSAEFQIPHRDPRDWRFPVPFTDEFLRAEEGAARALFASTERSIVATVLPDSLGLPHGYGGVIGWAMKALTDRAHAADYMLCEAEALRRRAAGYASAVKGFVDVLVMSHVDFGTQAGEAFDPGLFRELFLPAWKAVTEAVHAEAPRMKIFIHTCGGVRAFLPMFVEAGIDVCNPVQWTARGMDREELGAELGGRIVFWGGGVNTQATFPRGTPTEVRTEVAAAVRSLGRKGGLVLNPGHNIQADVPPRNIVAFYDAGKAS